VKKMMRKFIDGVLLAAVLASAFAQAQSVPVESLDAERRQAVQRGQFRAGEAYREWRDAAYEADLAEQEVLNLEDAYRHSSAQSAELKRKLDTARKALAASRAKAAAQRKTYDGAVEAVDRAWSGKTVAQ